ncbi:MAG: metallophosphoesterase [Rhizobiales bacterium]|nr:metallophosphoesterase [Hyphomicrobiales bacterium]NRB15490.1 metallophosphoesterase [Hyphomicrobiales bacterium]
MNILHITDIHFGPYHWQVDDGLIIDRINNFAPDIILNTGDLTSDSLSEEFRQARDFLAKLECKNIVSIMGNHDKYSKRSHEMFREYIYDGDFVKPKDVTKLSKKKVFINSKTAILQDYFTEINYLREFEIKGKKILVICVETSQYQDDDGRVEPQILDALSDEIAKRQFDQALLLTHHSVLSTDECPLINSQRVVDFIHKNQIQASFCGHTHELEMVEVKDLVRGTKFRQFMCGSLSSLNIPRESNMFCTYENFGSQNEIITVTRILPTDSGVEFNQTIIGG